MYNNVNEEELMNTKKTIMSGLMLALGIVIPYIFHITGINGSIFLPMHIPILLAGFIIGPLYAFILGIITPILNYFISGMPPFPMVIVMIFELATFGFVSGTIYKKSKNIIITLITSIIIGRMVGAIIVLLIGYLFDIKFIPFSTYITGAFITGLPGIIIQFILIPIIVKALELNNLIDN